MNIGYISLHRKIQDCFLWYSDEPFDRRSAWIDLLLLVNHEEKEIMFDGNKITVLKGQKITSIRFLADRWHWSTTKVRKYLELLKSENMIKIESDNKKTLLTVVNYEVYQNSKHTENTQKTHRNDTEVTQKTHRNDTEVTQKNTNNNDNNDNNENNDNKEKDIPPLSPKGKVTLISMIENKHFSPMVEETLKDWIQYKKEKHQGYKETGFNKLLTQIQTKINEYGEQAVIDCINLSMCNNWQGITWDKIKQPSGVDRSLHVGEEKPKEEPQEEPASDDDEIWSDERWEEEFKKRGL